MNFLKILSEYGRVCHICGDDIPIGKRQLAFDHVVPISRGGAHSYANIRPSHFSCNAKKHTKLMEEMPSGNGLSIPVNIDEAMSNVGVVYEETGDSCKLGVCGI